MCKVIRQHTAANGKIALWYKDRCCGFNSVQCYILELNKLQHIYLGVLIILQEVSSSASLYSSYFSVWNMLGYILAVSIYFCIDTFLITFCMESSEIFLQKVSIFLISFCLESGGIFLQEVSVSAWHLQFLPDLEGYAAQGRNDGLLHCTAQCTLLHNTALHIAVLHCKATHFTALHCTALHCTGQRTAHCTAPHFTALHCTSQQMQCSRVQCDLTCKIVTVRTQWVKRPTVHYVFISIVWHCTVLG